MSNAHEQVNPAEIANAYDIFSSDSHMDAAPLGRGGRWFSDICRL
jgi:hypothetical protein